MMHIKKSALYLIYLIAYAISTVTAAVGVASTIWWIANGKALFGLSTALIMAWIGIGGVMVFSAIFKNHIQDQRMSK